MAGPEEGPDACTCCNDLARTVGQAGGSAAGRFADDFALSAFLGDGGQGGSWAFGAIGELYTAEVLERLPKGWYITHDLAVGGRGANLDHVVIGPPGVFILNSKYHGEKPVLVDGEVYVAGRSTGQRRQGEREAQLATEALSRAAGGDVAAVSLIVIVAFSYRVMRQPWGSVRFAHLTEVVEFLSELRPQVSPCGACRLTRAVRDPATWVRKKN